MFVAGVTMWPPVTRGSTGRHPIGALGVGSEPCCWLPGSLWSRSTKSQAGHSSSRGRDQARPQGKEGSGK